MLHLFLQTSGCGLNAFATFMATFFFIIFMVVAPTFPFIICVTFMAALFLITYVVFIAAFFFITLGVFALACFFISMRKWDTRKPCSAVSSYGLHGDRSLAEAHSRYQTCCTTALHASRIRFLIVCQAQHCILVIFSRLSRATYFM